MGIFDKLFGGGASDEIEENNTGAAEAAPMAEAAPAEAADMTAAPVEAAPMADVDTSAEAAMPMHEEDADMPEEETPAV